MYARPWMLPSCSRCLLIITLFSAGCSANRDGLPELGEVTGTVTLNGSPLPKAVVEFVPEFPGRTASGQTDSAGAYRLSYTSSVTGAEPGAYQVKISTVQLTREYDEKGNEIPFQDPLPAKYHQNSELRANVTTGKNELNFELKSK